MYCYDCDCMLGEYYWCDDCRKFKKDDLTCLYSDARRIGINVGRHIEMMDLKTAVKVERAACARLVAVEAVRFWKYHKMAGRGDEEPTVWSSEMMSDKFKELADAIRDRKFLRDIE